MGRAAVLLATVLELLAGCAGLPREPIRFVHPANCPEAIVETLTVRQGTLGPWTETDTLECALSSLQQTDDLALRRSALGSRLALHLAERTGDAMRRERLAAEGVRFAEAAIALGADTDGAVHYYLAANLGLVIRDHVSLAVEHLPRIRSEAQRAVDLSPDIDDGGPLRLLGILYLKAPPWPTGFGDGETALALLAQAVEKHPDHPLNHLFYAEVLREVDETGNVDRIETEWDTGMRLLAEGGWGYNRAPWKKEFDRFRSENERPAR